MSLKKQHKPHPSTNRSNDMFIRPSAPQIAQMNKENPDKKVTNADFDPEVKLNHFGEPAFIQPNRTVQARMKMGTTSPKESKSDSAIQKMPDEDQEVQAKAKNDSPSVVQSSNTEGTSQTKNKTGMPTGLKSGLENLSGEDLSGVRVHHNSSKPDEIGAHAYAQGEDIYLGQGQEKHLPHEGWHVVQQKQGRVQPTIQQKSKLINNDADLEKEADVMGEKAVQMKANDSAPKLNNNRVSSRNGVIQRAMKFEYQFKSNFIKVDNGTNVYGLPRKFGPRDYIYRDSSGARFESESQGQIEFETTWQKKWPKLLKQVEAVRDMSKKMHAIPRTEPGSDGGMYRLFPLDWDISHLRSKKGVDPKTGNWNRRQKDGEAVVKSRTEEFENFRSDHVYDKSNKSNPAGNFLKEILNGEKVFVHYTQGGWSRIEHLGELGWMISSSLSGMENKNYEQVNEDTRGVESDKPLGTGDKLLIDERDPTWAPYTQISESMELEDYESYLKQYGHTFGSDLITDTRANLLERNTEIVPSGESPLEQETREDAFLDNYAKLKNLLLMVGHYIEKGRSQTTRLPEYQPDGSIAKTGPPGSAKFALNLMSRTHFGSIFDTLTPKEQVLFTQMVHDKTDGILNKMVLTRSSKFFMDGTSKGHNPTVYAWLVSITESKDILSSRSEFKYKLPGAMGRFKMGEEKGKHENLIRMEARNEPDNFPLIDKLVEHAERHFDLARANRSRPEGSGETGLEKPAPPPVTPVKKP